MKSAPSSSSRKVEKGIYQRGPASFQVKMMIGRQKISETFDTLAEARAWRDSKRASAALDPDFKKVIEARVRKRDAATTTLGSILDKYLEEVTPGKKGAEAEGCRIAKLKRSTLAAKSVYRITPDDVTAFLKGLVRDQKGPCQGQALTESSKRKYAALISHVYKIARKRWRLPVANPIADIELPAPGKSRKRRLEPGEEERLFAALTKARSPLMLPLVQLAIETAMRQSELLSLDWSDVRLQEDHGTATLHETKNGEMRIAPLNARACQILSGVDTRPQEGEEDGKVFPLGKHSVRSAWDKACERAGIEDLHFHDLRHEATSRLFELGLDKIEAAAVTGHKTLQMLKDYTHLRAEKLAKKLNRAKGYQGDK